MPAGCLCQYFTHSRWKDSMGRGVKKKSEGIVSSAAMMKEVIHRALEVHITWECRMLMYQTPLSKLLKHRGSVNAGHASPLQNARAVAPVGDAVIKPGKTDADTIQAPPDLIHGEITEWIFIRVLPWQKMKYYKYIPPSRNMSNAPWLGRMKAKKHHRSDPFRQQWISSLCLQEADMF